MSIYEPFRLAEARARERSDTLPRHATITQAVSFTGTGQHALTGDRALRFGTMMLEVPTFSYGVVAPHGLAGGMPLVTAAVTRWLTNDSGLYHGAELTVRVYHPDDVMGSDVLELHLLFSGMALRTGLPASSVPSA